MRIAYFDCFSGISGDMILGALLDAGLTLDALRAELSKVPVSGYTLDVRRSTHQGITGTQVVVLDRTTDHGPHTNGHGNGYAPGNELEYRRNGTGFAQILARSVLSEPVKQKVIAAISLLAKAETHMSGGDHNRDSEHDPLVLVHIVGAMAGLALLGVESVECSAINIGGGSVNTKDGNVPIPAPVTAEILRQASIPLYGTDANKELVTPAAAAIMAVVATAFGPMPSIAMDKVGYGTGKDETQGAQRFLRVTVGDLVAQPVATVPTQPDVSLTSSPDDDRIARIEANLDDLSPQQGDFVMEKLLAEGALDASLVPVQMRKNQPGMLLSTLCKPELVDSLAALIFEETGAPEVRITNMPRRRVRQDTAQVETTYGPIKVTVARDADGKVLRVKPEYDDVKKAALELNVAIDLINEEARNAWEPHFADVHQQMGRQRAES